MTELVAEPEAIDAPESSLSLSVGLLELPYTIPDVASFPLDSHGVDSGDALTANG